MELTALAYLEQSPGPSGKGLTMPLPADIMTSGRNGPQTGLQATGQLKLFHLFYLTLSFVSASTPHWPWMLEQRGSVGEELRKSPGLHYTGCGPCTPRTLWDEAPSGMHPMLWPPLLS